MEKQASEIFVLLAEFIEYNISMLGRTPKDTIAARLLVSQINDELRQLSENERMRFFQCFPETNEKLQQIDNFRRISECYPQSVEAQIEEPCCISPFEEWASYGAGNIQRPPYEAAASSLSSISSGSQVSAVGPIMLFDEMRTTFAETRVHDDRHNLMTKRPYATSDSDLPALVHLSSSWKKMDTHVKSNAVAFDATPPAEGFSQEYRDMVKQIILTGKLPKKVDEERTISHHGPQKTRESSKVRRKKSRRENRGKIQRSDSIRSMLREAREGKAGEQKKS